MKTMSSIPPQIDDIYSALSKEVTWLHGRWICYRQLFAESERRIEMLNECAATFFFIIQDVLIGEVQVCLSKLTDPAKTGKHDNLSLEQLQLRLEQFGDTKLAQINRVTLDSLLREATPFRTWRNKQLAHLDLLTSMKAFPNPLPEVSRKMIEDALSLVRQYLNSIEHHYNDSEIGYNHFIMSSDGDALLATLRYGLRYKELLVGREIPYDDWRKSKWDNA
jgi:hypothetical protein